MISYKVAKKREEKYSLDVNIGCYMYFFEHKSKHYCIDATAETDRLGRLFNHSKVAGNCHTKLFEMNSRPYLILVASWNIDKGEELMYDYGDRNKISLESHPWLAQWDVLSFFRFVSCKSLLFLAKLLYISVKCFIYIFFLFILIFYCKNLKQ